MSYPERLCCLKPFNHFSIEWQPKFFGVLSRPPWSASCLPLQPKDSEIRFTHSRNKKLLRIYHARSLKTSLEPSVRNNPLPPTSLFQLTPNYLFNSVKMPLLLVSFHDSLPPPQQTFLHLNSSGSWITLRILTVPPQNSAHLSVTTHITILCCNYVTLHLETLNFMKSRKMSSPLLNA